MNFTRGGGNDVFWISSISLLIILYFGGNNCALIMVYNKKESQTWQLRLNAAFYSKCFIGQRFVIWRLMWHEGGGREGRRENKSGERIESKEFYCGVFANLSEALWRVTTISTSLYFIDRKCQADYELINSRA